MVFLFYVIHIYIGVLGDGTTIKVLDFQDFLLLILDTEVS